MPDELAITNPTPAPPKQDTQCLKPVAVTTDGPMAKAWCWHKTCTWEKTFVIPENGVQINKLQSEHDGDVRP